MARFVRSCLQTSTRPSRKNFMKNVLRRRKLFSDFFLDFERGFFGFLKMKFGSVIKSAFLVSSRNFWGNLDFLKYEVVQTCLGLSTLNWSTSGEVFSGGWSKLRFTCPEELSDGKRNVLKKFLCLLCTSTGKSRSFEGFFPARLSSFFLRVSMFFLST